MQGPDHGEVSETRQEGGADAAPPSRMARQLVMVT